jgi:hypothetical protein
MTYRKGSVENLVGWVKPVTAPPSALTPEAIDLDGLLRRLHLPTIRRLYPELEDRAGAVVSNASSEGR